MTASELPIARRLAPHPERGTVLLAALFATIAVSGLALGLLSRLGVSLPR